MIWSAGGSTAGQSLPRRAVAIAAIACASLSMLARPASSSTGEGASLRVVVSAVPGAVAELAGAVARAGGRIVRELGIIDGFAAEIPAGALGGIARRPGVRFVAPDATVRPMSDDSEDAELDTTPEAAPSGLMSSITRVIGAQKAWASGITGRGVDVALIDTGVAPVPGLQPSRIVNGPDLSFDYQGGLPGGIDANGHGTHMAGIIAGRDDAATPSGSKCAECFNKSGYSDPTKFVGVAPEARILNVKVGAFDGAADVSQVIAAIDWVVQHRNDNGMNVRVLNLSYGTDSTQDHTIDPLAFAVEVAWRKGIFVVAAAGNGGSSRPTLVNPARDPLVFAVGASNSNDTLERLDDTVPAWSGRAAGVSRTVDAVAPGVSVRSLAVPGSYVASQHPGAIVDGGRLMKGSGTSQSAAVVSGVAALLLQRYPSATPDGLKALLRATSFANMIDPPAVRGAGIVSVAKALKAGVAPDVPQPATGSTGTGSLEASRGSMHVEMDGVILQGEQDVLGQSWSGQSWSGQSWSGQSWSGGSWNGQTWSGQSWSGQSWSNATWSGQSWSGQSWSGQSWSGQSWSGQSWSGQSWSGQSWSGQSWSGQSWSGQSWSGQSWSGQSWSSQSWS